MMKSIKKEKKPKSHSKALYCNDIELIIDHIFINTKFTKTQIRDIIDAQFRMLRKTTRSGGLITPDSSFNDYESIRLLRLGSFRPSEKKFKYIKEKVCST